MKKSILVTGGAGYIGSTVTKLLNLKGYNTLVLDNLSTGYEELIYQSSFYQGDLKDKEVLTKVFSENKIDAVMHFAALSSVGDSVKDPKSYYKNNLLGSLNLFDAMIDAGVSKLVFSSTAAVYGNPERIPIEEEAFCSPINPYGSSKCMVEQILQDYFKSYDLSSVALRYFNACGAEEGFEVGEAHMPETHLIPLAVRAANNLGAGLKVFGTDYPTADGTCIRDYIHVTDLAEAHLKALELLFEKPACLRLNLSNDNGFSVLEIIKEVELVTGKKIKVSYEGRRAGDPPTLIGESKEARMILDWKPKYINIRDIVKTVCKWQETNLYKQLVSRSATFQSIEERNGAGKGARTLDLRDGNATL